VNGDVVDWLFSVGLPISEPYWTRSKVGGVEKDVLVQAFERRMLTYTPSNSAAFQIEMGNVGRHYYQWRYGNATPTVQGLDPATLNLPGGLVWRREVQGDSGALSSLMYAPQAGAANNAGTLPGSATAPSATSPGSAFLYTSPDEAGRFAIRRNDLKGGDNALGYGLAPASSADGSKLAYSSFSGRWLLDLNLLDVQTGATQKVQSGVGLANAFSPDGQTLAFVSFANKQTSVAVRGPGGDVDYLKSYGADGQAIANLVWSPQGRFLAYTLLKLGGRDGGIVVAGSEVHVLDTVSGADIKIADEAARPSFAPDGKKLAFVAWGKNGLFVADWNNGAATNVQAIGTARGCRDECANTGTPAFSPDGHWLAVTAPSGGLSGVRLSDGASATLTGPANAYDRDPVWVK
jgi:hypothetical protein